jgi:hypothetical protein
VTFPDILNQVNEKIEVAEVKSFLGSKATIDGSKTIPVAVRVYN